MQVAFKNLVQTEELRKSLAKIGFGDARIQSITSANAQGNEFLIRMQKVQSGSKENESTKIQNVLYSAFGNPNPSNDGFEEWAVRTGSQPVIPEPASLSLLGLGLAGMAARKLRKRS